MKSKEKLIKIFFILIIVISMMNTTVFASNLTLKTMTDKEHYEVNDKVTVTVDWTEKMQAASFTIQYDTDRLQFESANIEETYYNTTAAGEISVNWVSLEEKDLTKINFVFKCIKSGEANIGIKEVSAFANENLVSPTSYNITTSGSKDITINDTKEQINQKEENTQKENTSSTDETIKKGILPKAGKDTLMIFIILSMAIISVIVLKKYKELSDI